MKIIFNSLLILATLYASAQAAQKPFDYYVLSLSWSPQFCTTHPKDSQCTREYGIVLHGLWPQYNKGYPKSCSKEWIATKLIRSFPDLYPSEKLAIHEWVQHGTCSGLSPTDYLKLSQKLKQSVVMPDVLQNLAKPLRVSSSQLNALMQKANPNLSNNAIAFSCADGGRFLQEIYLCFDKKGETSAACGVDIQRRSRLSCGRPNFLIRNVR
ncbi:ribonuclease [Crenothrix sp.]|uniref:ribonuclease T2 family protein n=1 Tax=Crenothrix sp. TaxID=3100433 RepID=UPI00374DC467